MAEWQKTRLETLKLKLEVVEQQLMHETYLINNVIYYIYYLVLFIILCNCYYFDIQQRYAERDKVNPVDGLKSIAHHLKQALEEARGAHEKAVTRRTQYESVGLGLPDLASEYGKVSFQLIIFIYLFLFYFFYISYLLFSIIVICFVPLILNICCGLLLTKNGPFAN